MDSETLDFLAEMERETAALQTNDALVPSGERLCPICQQTMRVETEYGVSIDVCDKHGMWLDRGELPSILARVRSGQRVNRVQAIKRARRDGKVSGSMFGMWSLLFD